MDNNGQTIRRLETNQNIEPMVKEISSLAEFEREIGSPGLVVVDFFTTWYK